MAKDLTVKLEADKPGAFSRIAEALGGAGVNIEGAAEMEGVVHLLVENAAGAKQALQGAGLTVDRESDPVVVKLEDRPGELAAVTRRLAAAGVNVQVVYLATGTRVVFIVDDPEMARQEVG